MFKAFFIRRAAKRRQQRISKLEHELAGLTERCNCLARIVERNEEVPMYYIDKYISTRERVVKINFELKGLQK
jgi:t-SNARE complex subunit (syntaxin)